MRTDRRRLTRVVVATGALCAGAVVLSRFPSGVGTRDAIAADAGADAPAAATRPATRAAGPATAPAAADAKGFALTIYSTADPATFSPQDLLREQMDGTAPVGVVYAPGYGVVREVRRVDLSGAAGAPGGAARVEFTDVAAGIDPTTVAFRSLTAPDATAVLEQNFEFDVTGSWKLLRKYLGREVVLVPKPAGAQQAVATVRGTLLAVDANGYGQPVYTVQTDGVRDPIVIHRGDDLASVRLAAPDAGLVTKPTLNWKVATDRRGPHDVQVTYQTDGLTWRADYNAVIAEDDASAELSAWVTVLNASGRGYPDARLKLVAGNVQRYEPERQRYGGGGGGGGLFGGGGQDRAGFQEKGFFEYHMYTLSRPTSLPNNSTKNIELFPARGGIKTEKVFVYYGLPRDVRYQVLADPNRDRDVGDKSNREVDVYMRFMNTQANNLGLPLPAGRVRLYKVDAADGNPEFIGEDIIRHTPKDEEVLLRVGSAFDLVGERRQTNYEDEPRVIRESYEITLRNRKDVPVRIIVKENLFRWFNWELIAISDKYEKFDSRTIHIPIDVPPGGERKVTYTVKYTW